jgi:hypothetical protein
MRAINSKEDITDRDDDRRQREQRERERKYSYKPFNYPGKKTVQCGTKTTEKKTRADPDPSSAPAPSMPHEQDQEFVEQ